MMPRMTTFGTALRLIAITLVVVLMVTIATPKKAEAMDPFTIMAILGAAAVVAIIVAYLIIANTRGPKMEKDDAGMRVRVMVACVEVEGQPRSCWAVDHPEQKIAPEDIQPVAPVTGFATPALAPQS
jgi:hypothetical protein